MSGPKIDVSANLGNVESQVDKLSGVLDKLSQRVRSASKAQYHPLSPKALDDLKKASSLLDEIAKKSGQSGGAGAGFIGGGGNPTGPAPSSPLPPPPSSIPGNHPNAPGRRGSLYSYRHGRLSGNQVSTEGLLGRAVGAMSGGFGGGVSQTVQGGLTGMSGGGGMSGLVRGGLIGAGLFAAFKGGQAVSEGYDNSKTLAIDMDRLKRQMGDTGVSFRALQDSADLASRGLEINSVEAGKLMTEFNRLSGGVKDTTELAFSTRAGVGLSKAFGLDPSQGVQFLAKQRDINRGGSLEGDRRLAMLIGDAVSKSGMSGRADELMAAIQGFSATVARDSMSAPNVEGFAGMYSGMLSSKIAGLTPENASAMLGRANSAVSNMGAFGEAGESFMLSALSRNGGINPIQAKVLAEGGMFGTREQAFGRNSIYRRYMLQQGKSESDVDKLMGRNRGETNFQAIVSQLNSLNVPPEIKAEMAKNELGLGSTSQAMALLSIAPERMGKTQSLMARNGIDFKNVNESGIETLSRVANAGGMGDLNRVSSDLLGRTGKGALSDKEKDALRAAQADAAKIGGREGFEKLQDALTKLASDKDKQETLGSQIVDQQKRIETAMTTVGNQLLGPITTMKEALLTMTGLSSRGVKERAAELEKQDIDARFRVQDKETQTRHNKERVKLENDEQAVKKLEQDMTRRTELGNRPSKKEFTELNRRQADVVARRKALDARQRAEDLAADKQRIAEKQAIDDQMAKELKAEQKGREIGQGTTAGGRPIAPSGMLGAGGRSGSGSGNGLFDRLVKQESGGVHVGANGRLLTSSKGAQGISQVMPKTGVTPGFGVKPMANQSRAESLRFGRDYLNAMLREFGGDERKALAAYNWGAANVKRVTASYGNQWLSYAPNETRNYVSSIMGDGTPVPEGNKLARAERNSAQQGGAYRLDGEFRLVGEDGRQRANPVQIRTLVSTPRSAGR